MLTTYRLPSTHVTQARIDGKSLLFLSNAECNCQEESGQMATGRGGSSPWTVGPR